MSLAPNDPLRARPLRRPGPSVLVPSARVPSARVPSARVPSARVSWARVPSARVPIARVPAALVAVAGWALLLAGCGGASASSSAASSTAADPSVEANVLVRVPGAADEDREDPPYGQTGRPPITMLAAGRAHTCALTEGGAVYCWGSNRRGQLGELGDASPVPAAVPGLPPMAAVWAGWDATCARTADDAQLFCWGETGFGQPQGFAHAMPYRGVRAVNLGPQGRGCFIDGDGALFCWGEYGRPHGPNWGAPTRVDLDGVTSVALGWIRGCAVRTDGEASCWGQVPPYLIIDRHRRGRTWSYVGLEDVSEMAFFDAAQALPVVLDMQGVVKVMERGSRRRRHTGEAELDGRPLPGLTDVVQLSVGHAHACARTSAGVLGCWGGNGDGQLGDGTEARRRDEPRLLTLAGVQEVAAGGRHTCARTAAQLFCWGSNRDGQLGVEGLRETRDVQEIPW